MTMELYNSALNYLNHNISIIPVGKNKIPLISWKVYQQKRATEDEVNEWFKKFPDMQIGIVTGEISNLTVVDIEHGGDSSFLPQNTSIVKTGGGGWHYYFKYEPGTYNTARTRPLVDTRSEGGYVIAPPSVSDKGAYVLIKKLPLLPFPLELFGGKKEEKKGRKNFRDLVSGVGTGSRNQSAASIIGILTRYLPEYYWGTTIWPLLEAWNNNNDPPLPGEELSATYESICNKERFAKAKYYQNKNV